MPGSNHRVPLLLLAFLLVTSAAAYPKSFPRFLLTQNGKPACSICLDRDASEIDRKAAAELQRYVNKISGATLPIVHGTRKGRSVRIWIGSAGHIRDFPVAIAWDSLDDDGFTIQTRGRDVFIAGGKARGSLFAVYTLLEKFLGCRKYSPTVEVVPKRRTIALPPISITQVPGVTFRDACCYDPEYMAWQKLDDHNQLFGLYAHTFSKLVPPEQYFKEHPEYYSETRAGRIPDGQLCLTNPEVEKIVVDNLRSSMRDNPTALYWSVSQNDTFSPCECDACRAIDSVEGSNSGSLLSFVNRIARQFPDKIISTLAYQYSQSAPRHIRPRDNVNIMLCSIECNRSRPLETDSTSASFRKDLRDWTSITKNIYLWDYVVQFRNLMSPFPNLRVLQPNIQYFVKQGITAIYEQGSGTLPCEFKELRTYLLAKLLWDPDINVDSVMDDFLRGYYGKAAPDIRGYIDTMHDALAASGEDLGIYGFPLPSEKGYLSPSNMDKYVSFFDKAERSVRDDEEILQRVRLARLPLQFALLEQAKIYGTGARGFFEMEPDSTWHVKPSMEKSLEIFVSRCKEYGITALNEMGTTPDEYLSRSESFLQSSMHNHLALFRPVTLTFPASAKYHNGDASVLTDGLMGLDDYHLNWLGFHGEDMEATIDLGSVQSVRSFRTDFLQDVNAWIFLPVSVELSVSSDGVTFRRVVEIQRAIPQDRKGVWSVPYEGEFEPVEARFVRVRAASLRRCPEWHRGAGGLCWIFADEIIIN